MRWYGSDFNNSENSELVIALLKYWHEKYGSELVCHYGTILQLTTKKLPTSPEEAFQLAWEQEVITPYLSIETDLSDHARELLHSYRWFLHERL